MQRDMMSELRASESRRALINHRFFSSVVNSNATSREDVAVVLGQWWHPLHYFPTFLARAIAVSGDLGEMSFLADILDEELGCGNPSDAHERIFVDTMSGVGFAASSLTQASPLPATVRLLDGYQENSTTRLGALGCAFATEVADLAMVGGIGKLVRRVTGASSLPWVDIHISQEPNHVGQVTSSLQGTFSSEEVDIILQAADTHWNEWCGFFEDICVALAPDSVRAVARETVAV